MPDEKKIERPLEEEEKAKFLAEADAATALAEVRRLEAQITAGQLQSQKWGLEREKYEHDAILAGNAFHHVYTFNTAVNEASVVKAMDTLQRWSRMDPGCAIELVFSSPGGSVVEGLAFWDFLSTLKSEGHRLTTVALGYAASMAGILLQAGDVRIMGRESWLLIHQVSAVMGGSWGELKDRQKWIDRTQDRIVDIFYERSQCADPALATRRLTRRQIKNSWDRTDWWIDSDDALKYGFADSTR